MVIFCPLAIEQRLTCAALRRAGHGRVRVRRAGLGAASAAAAVERAVRQGVLRPGSAGHEPGAGAVLVGVAGGLVDQPQLRSAQLPAAALSPLITGVIDLHGRSWRPTRSAALRPDEPGVTLVGVDAIVHGQRDKRALAERLGVALVDMESHGFARACQALGVPWAVIRGVSDGPAQDLPRCMGGWFTADGRLRALRVARDLALRPWLIPGLMALNARTRAAMGAACQRLLTLLGPASAPAEVPAGAPAPARVGR